MIVHIVLFHPRGDLTAAEQEDFAASFQRAITGIPQVRRARVGERINLGRLYDKMNMRDFSHVAIIEFDSEEDLLAYLDHPAHDDLGRRFYQTAEATLVYDFDVVEGSESGAIFRSVH